MRGKMTVPLRQGDRDLTKATIDASRIEGGTFGGIRVDRVVKTEICFEIEYTVVSEKLKSLLLEKPRVSCSVGRLETK